MNWVDLILIVIVALAAWGGWRRGFIRGTLDLFTWVGSIALGFIFYPYVADGLDKLVSMGPWLLPLAFIFTTIAARILTGLIVKRLLRFVPEKLNHDTVNRFFGIIPGAFNGLIYATIIAACLLALPLKKSITVETQHSEIAKSLSVQAGWANRKLAPVFDQAVRQTMNSFSGHKDHSHEEVKLQFTYEDPIPRPDLEAKMLELINCERASEGLHPLTADPRETLVGRAHSRDMFAKGYFAHVNLEGKDPFDRMKDANLHFRTAGENLALAQTLEIAHDNLMKSPGHRKNIMNPAFNRVGIGIEDGGFYGLMISQEFRN
jgi:uncharacterized protein YkwD